jgi:hypothetical protein
MGKWKKVKGMRIYKKMGKEKEARGRIRADGIEKLIKKEKERNKETKDENRLGERRRKEEKGKRKERERKRRKGKEGRAEIERKRGLNNEGGTMI